MSKRSGRNLRYLALALLLIGVMATGLGLGASSSASAVPSSRPAPRDANPLAAVDSQLVEKMQATSGPLTVMIELSGQPATVASAASQGIVRGKLSAAAIQAGKRQHASNDQAQQDVLRALTNAGASVQVLYRVQNAYNGIAAIASKQDIAKIQQIAGIKAIHLMVPHTIDNASSVPLIGAPVVWENYGYTGDGISIGVIDTGIDYIHTNFGGSGDPNDYLVYTDTTPMAVTAAAGVYPTEKVVGGYDFAGDTYNADPNDPNYQPVPLPDDNPLDCAAASGGGHGSHVSGTAAGYGVNADGSTYTGAYNTTSVPTNTMRIGPGVAPEADLYALRVFGCTGSTNLVEQAIDWATDPNGDSDFSDHLDVINMSLGSSYGTPDDSSAAASNNAALIGVQVVTSAGNSGDVYYVTGSPGTATWALSTASSTDEVDVTDGFRVNPPSVISGTYPASQSANYDWSSPPVTATIYYPSTNVRGCVPWTGADLTNITNTHPIVLVDWRTASDTTFQCGSAVRTNNAQAAGAVGIIMVDKTTFPESAIAGNSSIPAMITVKQVGDTLKSILTAGVVQTETVTLSGEYHNSVRLVTPGHNNNLSSFSSRGPRSIDNALKPDISAPGQGTFSTAAGTGDEGETLSGTSMASPHMAGTMALLRQAHPSWTVEELKALAMNTANVDIWTGLNNTGTRYAPGRVGAGRVNVPFAATNEVVAYNAETDGAVSVSFGFVNVLGTSTLTKTVEIANKGTSPVVYQLGYIARTTVPGVTYSFPDGNVVSVPAGGTATFRVQLDAIAADMRNTLDPTVAQVQSGLTRNWLNEASGLITLTPTGRPDISGQVLRVPLYSTLRPASDMTTAEDRLVVSGATTTTSLNLVGQGVNTGNSYPNDFTSLVTAMELAATSGQEDLDALNVTETARHADLQYVGITSDGPARTVLTDTEIFFGIATHGSWTTPASEMEFDIYIDTDEDGSEDYALYNTRLTDTDVAVTALVDLNNPGPASLQDVINYYLANLPPTAEMNNSVMVMPVYAADL
ncbi:MAG TPA: S8 family serine peptidase, partial [Chloroflexia bacterium]